MVNNYKSYKIAKKRLINKYQLNRESDRTDSFISINDFLANEHSKGPLADPADIHYFYQNYENINNFIHTLITKLGFEEIICKPDTSLKYKHNNISYITSNAMLYDYDDDKLVLAHDFKDNLIECMNNDKRFVYFILMLVAKEHPTFSHANIIIIDLYKKIIERYEPYGKYSRLDKNNIIGPELDHKFENILLKYFKLREYKYLSPAKISPPNGIQSKADAYKGMCVTYSLLYFQLRIMNPDISQHDIITYITKKTKKKIIDIILRYAKFVEDTLKKYSQDIKQLQSKLYNNQFKNNKYLAI